MRVILCVGVIAAIIGGVGGRQLRVTIKNEVTFSIAKQIICIVLAFCCCCCSLCACVCVCLFLSIFMNTFTVLVQGLEKPTKIKLLPVFTLLFEC